MTGVVDRIERLFVEHGSRRHDDVRGEPVSALEHALQCARLAESAGATPALVAAALLHDIGHFVTDVPAGLDDAHELRALPLLRDAFDGDVTEPIRLHVDAKRYLVATDPGYLAGLSPASVHSLAMQGGAMTAAEVADFERRPHAADGVALRRWDDLAKRPGRSTPPLGWYLGILEDLRRAATRPSSRPRA